MLNTDREFLASLGISAESIRTMAPRPAPTLAKGRRGRGFHDDRESFAGRLFRGPQFSGALDVLKACEGRAILRFRTLDHTGTFLQYIRDHSPAGDLELSGGLEIDVVLGTREPERGDLLLFPTSSGVAVVVAEEVTGSLRSLQVPVSFDGRTLSGYALIRAVGPRIVPKLAAGDCVELAHMGSARFAKTRTARVERITSRSVHLRYTGSRITLTHFTHEELRAGPFVITKVDA